MFAIRWLAGACLAGALTACGSGGHPAPAPRRTTDNAARPAAARRFAQCVRSHGLPDFPDLVYNARLGHWELPPGVGKPPASAINACASIGAGLFGNGSDRPPTAAEMAMFRSFAQCMRRRGVQDWPDPNPDGSFPLPPRLREGGKRVVASQFRVCAHYIPNGGGVRVSTGGPGDAG